VNNLIEKNNLSNDLNNFSRNNNNDNNWINNNQNINQAFYNSCSDLPNPEANLSLNAIKSPINKNFFDENNLYTNSINMHSLNLSSSSAANLNHNANNTNNNIYIPNFTSNSNLTNNIKNLQETVYKNYNSNINNNSNLKNNLNFSNNFNNNNNNNNFNNNNNNYNNTISDQIIGCNCTKSNCTKKYCECFKAGKTCIEACRCRDCDNIDCIQRKLKNKRKFKHGNNLSGSVYEDFVIEKISIHIEKSNIFIKESFIWNLRDINKKEVNNSQNAYGKLVNNSNIYQNNCNNNSVTQEKNETENFNRNKIDLNNLITHNNKGKSLEITANSNNDSSDFDELENKQNENIKNNDNDNSRCKINNKKVNLITKNTDKSQLKIKYPQDFENKDLNSLVEFNEINTEKRSSLKNKKTTQLNNKDLEIESKLNKLENEINLIKSSNKIAENLNQNIKNNKKHTENLKINLAFEDSNDNISFNNKKNFLKDDLEAKTKHLNLSDLSFENKTPSQNDNNSKNDFLYEEASFSDSNNSIENINIPKEYREEKRFNRKLKNIKCKNENKSQQSSEEKDKNKISPAKINEVEKIIFIKNYKNFVSKNTFDTVSSFHNSIKKGKNKDDLTNDLMSYSNNNLHLGLMNNANKEFEKFESRINENFNKNILPEKVANQREEVLLNKKKSRDYSS